MGMRISAAILVGLAVLVVSAGCSFPNQEGASAVPAGQKPPAIEKLTNMVAKLSVPPFNADFRKVQCAYMKDALVLCSGVVYSTLTHRHSDRVRVLFRLEPQSGNPPLRPVCSQGRYGITPTFNISCAS